MASHDATPARSRGPSIQSALSSLESPGAITAALYTQYTAVYTAAERTLEKLSGSRRTELADVLANVQAIAAKSSSYPRACRRCS